MVVAGLQDGGGDLAAAFIGWETVVARAKLSAVEQLLDGLYEARAARGTARPVGVALLHDSARLERARPRLRGLGRPLVRGNFGEL